MRRGEKIGALALELPEMCALEGAAITKPVPSGAVPGGAPKPGRS